MSNNKQSMKLYTEEQLKEIYFKGVHNGRMQIEGKCSDEINSLTPIELPSDEEIWDKADEEDNNGKHYAFTRGAKWMRNKVQRGNNKQYHIENGSEIWNDTVNPPTVEVVSYWVMEEDQMIEICDTYEEAVEYINQLNKNNEQQY